MSHNLEQRNGQASMFYTGDVPWHQLGRKLDRPATAAEAMEAARLDYTVVKRPTESHYSWPALCRRSKCIRNGSNRHKCCSRCCRIAIRTSAKQRLLFVL